VPAGDAGPAPPGAAAQRLKNGQPEYFMNDGQADKEAGLVGYFTEPEKQDVFPAASMDGFTAVRKIPDQSGLRTRMGCMFSSSG
jgi:hypothetical protein